MKITAPIIGLIVAVLLTAVFWFFLYKPLGEEQAVVEAEIETLEGRQAQLRTQIAQLEDVEARQVEIRAALARLEEFIPNGPAQPTAIRQLQRAADAAGAEIAQMTFGEPTVPEPAAGAVPGETGVPGTILANIPVTMAVEGGYFQVVDFFRRLEVDVPRAALVETVEVLEEEDEGFPTLSATWTGQIFAVVPLADLVDVDAAQPVPSPTATPTPGGES